MLERSIQSVQEVDWNGCYNVASTASWSWLKWMLQHSIQSVWEVDWNGCWKVACTASWSSLKWMLCMLQRNIQSVWEVDSSGCYNVASRASWSCLKWMLQRSIQSVFEVDWNGCWNIASRASGKFRREVDWNGSWNVTCTASWSSLKRMLFYVMLQRNIQSVFEVDSSGCYNVASRASWNWLPERVASWLKWMLERKFQHLGVAWKRFSNITRENGSWGGKDHFEALKLLRLPHKSRGHIRPYPRVTFARTP